jgi:hypothetical protein
MNDQLIFKNAKGIVFVPINQVTAIDVNKQIVVHTASDYYILCVSSDKFDHYYAAADLATQTYLKKFVDYSTEIINQ